MRRTVAARSETKAGAPTPSGRTVLLTGGTGAIGRQVVRRLLERGDGVIVLTRDAARARRVLGPVPMPVERLADIPAAQPVDAVVNLAGAPLLGRRWGKARKQVLAASRVALTRTLVDWMARRTLRPEVLVSASAIGWYGANRDDAAIDETAPAGGDFAAALCSAWEREAASAEMLGLRVCRLRLGVVLDRAGGMLPALLPSFRLCLGARIGDGRQWLSWIHVEDAVELILRAIADPLFAGAINATAPEPVRQKDFATVLGRALHRPVLLRLPRALFKALLGESAAVVTEGQRVVPRRALQIGFAFRWHDIDAALGDLLAARPAAAATHGATGGATGGATVGAAVRLLDNMLT